MHDLLINEFLDLGVSYSLLRDQVQGKVLFYVFDLALVAHQNGDVCLKYLIQRLLQLVKLR